ncbi:hypothetical protein [Geomonas propionica]|uniref:hypothetical protein n=1 Tax=Geomonas propionica TaxID=2798582 RepID=UPI0018F0ACF1|nr:hypothetical protein [Geomonas propionica]
MDAASDDAASELPATRRFTLAKAAVLLLLIILLPSVLPGIGLFLLPIIVLVAILVYKVTLRASYLVFKNRMVGNYFIGGGVCLFAFFAYYPPSDLYERYLQPSTCITNAPNTAIVAHMEEAIKPGRNLIYCTSFQKAWNRLHDDIIKGDVLLASQPATAQQLNKQLLHPEDLSKDAFVAEAAPWTPELVARIKRELQEKFGDEASGYSIPDPPAGRQRIMAYAFLYKHLEFPIKFERLEHPVEFCAGNTETPVKAFGVDVASSNEELHQKLRGQVSVLYYRNEDQFALSLTSKSADDEIILAKIAPGTDLLQTYRSVMMNAKKAHPTALEDGEPLQVPKLDFDLTHHFRELEKQEILNEGWKSWYFETAEQQIKFKLDETGAIVKSRVKIGLAMKEEAPAPVQVPRRFIFDKPFLICLKQKNGHVPYFSMWVNNAELLVKQ